MDCSSEEQLIRVKLDTFENIQKLDFDLSNRKLTVYHTDNIGLIENSLLELKLNSTLLSTEDVDSIGIPMQHIKEKKLLRIVLLINFSMFLLEIITGFVSHSMGLIADSLDMLADAIVYGLSLYAVGSLATTQRRIARTSGIFQMALAVFGLAEVVKRFLGYEEVPVFQTMIVISLFALAGNAVSMYLLQSAKSKEAHIQASMIFTSNDVLANIGVIAAGVLVYFTHSKVPDLVIGTIVFILVARGALRILKL